METATWTVVQFIEDGSVEAVPTKWIEGENCYWPPLQRGRLMTAIKKLEASNNLWTKYKVKIFRNNTFDDYMKKQGKGRREHERSAIGGRVTIGEEKKVNIHKR
ncbi:uncharacterized protein LOC143363219 [Halictus rubicundus]|uniref:uncharacterized protein LOC143363219 n=1 Tax=Halictus rubicundus TaxID=77578 RepID=UPI00403588B2